MLKKSLVLLLLFFTVTTYAAVASPIRVAVVLGGGGVRSFASLGVLKVLEENHVPIDLIVGTSMGSIVGSLYANEPDANALIPLLLAAKKNELLDISLFAGSGGLDDGHQMRAFLRKQMGDKDFSQLKIKFVAVATDLATGEPYVMSSGPVAPAVNASAALPPVFLPVKLDGHTLVDGGASDVVPVNVAKRYHPEIIIAVNVVQNPGDKITAKHMFGISKRYNELRMRNFADGQAAQADVVITPAVGMTGTFDVNARPAMVKAGEAAALQALPQIKALMAARLK